MPSQLRQEFETYLIVSRLAPRTQTAYMNSVIGLATFHNKSPDCLTQYEIMLYIRHLIEDRKLSWSSVNVQASALKFFYQKFLKWDDTKIAIPPRPRERKLPEIMSREETIRLIDATGNIKHKALLSTVYSGGLRVSEVVRLKPNHIDSDKMLIRVEDAKGRKDRYTLLAHKCLDYLRTYWRISQPKPSIWLFPGRDIHKPLDIGTAQRIFYLTKKKAGINRGKGIHTLRHCFAGHLHERGYDPFVIKRLLGHSSFRTTARYLHVSRRHIENVISPLDM